MGFIVGDLFTFVVLFNITKHMDPKSGFGLASILSALLGLSFLFMVKEPNMKKIHRISLNNDDR
jgi:competence protein ComGC